MAAVSSGSPEGELLPANDPLAPLNRKVLAFSLPTRDPPSPGERRKSGTKFRPNSRSAPTMDDFLRDDAHKSYAFSRNLP